MQGRLNSDRQREGAEIAILITMTETTKPMLAQVLAAGKFKYPLLNREDHRIQVVTIDDILAGKTIDLPMGRKTVKSASAIGDEDSQIELA